MSNVIAFSLWGANEKYLNGAEENFKLQPLIYPNWKCRLYCDETVPADARKKFQEVYDVDVRLMENNRGPFYGSSWRFHVHDDETVGRFLIRDCDSRLNWRERAAVDAWIFSAKAYHFMRDHPHHNKPIQAGMWGGATGGATGGTCDNGALRSTLFKLGPFINQWPSWDQYGCDEAFLSCFYPFMRNDACVHDPFFEKIAFPPHRPILDGGTFVGQPFVNNRPVAV